MPRAFIAVGSNLGERQNNIERALDLLTASPSTKVVTTSKLYETDPVGGPAGQGKYLNAVWEIETDLSAGELMKRLLEIEVQLGRVRTQKNAPRTIDLDILFYGREIIDRPSLTVPHPRLHERAFVLEPMVELDPDFVHPVLKKTIRQLWEQSGYPK